MKRFLLGMLIMAVVIFVALPVVNAVMDKGNDQHIFNKWIFWQDTKFEEDITYKMPAPIAVAASTTLTNDQVRGQLVIVSAACTVTLPAVADCGIGSWVTIIERDTAETVIVEVDDNDLIILNGVTLHDGDGIDSPGSSGASVSLIAADSTGWRTFDYIGTWTDGGAT